MHDALMNGSWLSFKAQDPRNDYATSAPQYLSIHLGRFGDKRPADPQADRTPPVRGIGADSRFPE